MDTHGYMLIFRDKFCTVLGYIPVFMILSIVSSLISHLLLQIAEMIRHLLDVYEQPIPAVLEIPSKDHPYDPTKDTILRRAKVRH